MTEHHKHDYSKTGGAKSLPVNEQNKAFIDRFVSENYERLNRQFANQREVINSSGFGSIDKLNQTILALYTDPELHFTSWEQADKYLSSKFTDAEIRLPMKKPTKETEENELNND
ncbi:hypothetical protein [Phocaeicola sp.]